MSKEVRRVLSSRRGVSVWIVLLLAGILALLVTMIVPSVRRYQEEAAVTGCEIALGEARRKIENALIIKGAPLTEEEAKYAAVREIKDWSELCPAGGDCYLRPDGEGGYNVVCALHTEDGKLRTRLNAQRALDGLQSAAATEMFRNGAIPDALTLTVNSRALAAERVDEEPPIKRGTRTTPGYEGTVALYLTDGGEVTCFCYADEEYCAIWRAGEGWSGDSWAP